MDLIVTLIIAGLLLLLVEIMLVPGVGIAGILGVGSLVASSVLAWTEFGAETGLIVTSVNLVLIIVLLVVSLRAKMWKRFELKTNIESKVSQFAPGEIKVGDSGVTLTRLVPRGTVRFGQRQIECKAAEDMIDPGVSVTVVHVEDSQVFVRKSDN